MNNKALLLAVFCAATLPAASLWADDKAAGSADIQTLERAWHDTQFRAENGSASQPDVLAARIRLAEARIREEQQAIVAARKEDLAIVQALQQKGAVSASDVALADAALRQAQLATIKN